MQWGLGLLVLTLCAWAGTCEAALPGPVALQFRARQWSQEQGLPQVSVLDVAQDADGFIWTGTQDGLARFDGAHFKVFTPDTDPGLADSYITAILPVGDDLWIGTLHGISVYTHGAIRAVTRDPRLTDEVYGFARVRGRLLAATQRGLFELSIGKPPVKVGGAPNGPLNSITGTADGTLWLGGVGGAWSRSPGEKQFRFHALPDPTLRVTALVVWKQQIWLATQGGLFRVDGDAVTRYPDAPLAHGFVRSFLAGPHGNLWVGTESGLFRIDANGEVQDFRLIPLLGAQRIRSLAADREGDIWLGLAGEGLVRLHDNHLAVFGKTAGMDASEAFSVYLGPHDRTWVGTSQGVYELRDGRLARRFVTKDLPDPLVMAFLRVEDTLWIGTLKGLAMARDGKLIPLPHEFAKIPPDLIYSLVPTGDGGVWIGTSAHLYRWEPGQLRRFGPEDGVPSTRIRVVARLADGSVWLGTEHGLYIRGPRGGKFHAAGHGVGLDNSSVQGIYQAVDGTVWLVLRNSALVRYKNGRFTRYGAHDGLYGRMTLGVVGDGHGRLWVSGKVIYSLSVADIDRFDAGTIKRIPISVYPVPDALEALGCNGGGLLSLALDREGRLWCPSEAALVAFDTRDLPLNKTPPPVAIEAVEVGKKHYVAARVPEGLSVPPGNTSWRFSYAGLTFQDIEGVEFRYKLDGFDKDWVDAGTRREASYTNLPPGRYVFEVEARNSDGTWSTQPAKFTLTLLPFFYQTLWFRILVGVVVVLLVYGAYYWRVRRMRAQKLALEAIVAQRTAELKAASARLAEMSVTDTLTGLKNRRYLIGQIVSDIKQSRRSHAGPHINANYDTVFFMADIDDFKHVNDTRGHLAGDRLLVEIGRILGGRARESDYVVRWGGEEFLIVARQTDVSGAPTLAERLRGAVENGTRHAGHEVVPCTCSIGFCGFPLSPGNLDVPDWEGIVALADLALYRAKASGKNTWVGIVGKSIRDAQTIVTRAQDDLDGVIENGELELVTANDPRWQASGGTESQA